jgi:2-methylisocitrate lyase-like PEP mutase family enzyme
MGARELVERLLEIGAAGCNLEDIDRRAGGLAEAGAQPAGLAGVRSAADEAGVPLVINARVDTFLPGSRVPGPDQIAVAATWPRCSRPATSALSTYSYRERAFPVRTS